MDGFWIEDVTYSSLTKAVKKAKVVLKAVTTPQDERSILQDAIAGLERFIMFAEDLIDQIEAAPSAELGTSQLDLYRYWFLEPRDNLRQVVDDALNALNGEEFRKRDLPVAGVLDKLFEQAQLRHQPIIT